MEDLFTKALNQAKAELKARYITEKVAMRTMKIYLESKRKEAR